MDAHDGVREQHGKLAKDPNLSPIGRLDKSREFVAKTTAKQIANSRKIASDKRAANAKTLQSIKPKSPDKTDTASAMVRMDLRNMLRAMPASKRMAYASGERVDPRILEAIFEAPAVASGLDDESYGRLMQESIKRAHPEALAEVKMAEETVELLEAAVGLTFSAAKNIGEFPSDAVLEKFIESNAPTTPATADPSDDPIKLLNSLGPTADWQKESDETHERILAEARAELAASGVI